METAKPNSTTSAVFLTSSSLLLETLTRVRSCCMTMETAAKPPSQHTRGSNIDRGVSSKKKNRKSQSNTCVSHQLVYKMPQRQNVYPFCSNIEEGGGGCMCSEGTDYISIEVHLPCQVTSVLFIYVNMKNSGCFAAHLFCTFCITYRPMLLQHAGGS